MLIYLNCILQEDSLTAPQQMIRLDQAHLMTRPQPEIDDDDNISTDWEGESSGRGKSEQRFFIFNRTPILTVYSFVPTAITSTSTRYCIKSLHYGGITGKI